MKKINTLIHKFLNKKSLNNFTNSEKENKFNINEPFLILEKTGHKKKIKNYTNCFAIDSSESTSNILMINDNKNYLDVQKKIINNMIKSLAFDYYIISWNSYAKIEKNLENINPNNCTFPWSIFVDDNILNIFKKLDIFIMTTDGEIDFKNMNIFGNYIIKYGKNLKAIIGIIFGNNNVKPENVNISVFLPAMIGDSTILYCDGFKLYILWACGIFKNKLHPVDIKEKMKWSDITQIKIEELTNIYIDEYYPEDINYLFDKKYISFGSGMYFNPDNLLSSELTYTQLKNLPFNRICQYFKVSNKYYDLILWFIKQKNNILSIIIPDESDKNEYSNLIDNLMKKKNEDIINKFIYHRTLLIIKRYFDNFDINIDDQIIYLTNKYGLEDMLIYFKSMINIMYEDYQNQTNTPSTYTISNARYNNIKYYSNIVLPIKKIPSFEEPYKWYKIFINFNDDYFRCECSICYQIDIPFILIRNKFFENNDIIFFPSNYIYPNIVCYQCADHFCYKKEDPYKQKCIGAIPIIKLDNINDFNYFENFSKLTISNDNSKNKILILFNSFINVIDINFNEIDKIYITEIKKII